jgi:hypothetical protein
MSIRWIRDPSEDSTDYVRGHRAKPHRPISRHALQPRRILRMIPVNRGKYYGEQAFFKE